MVEQAVTAAAAGLPRGAGGDAPKVWNDALERGGVWSDAIAPAATALASSDPVAKGGTPVLPAPIVAEASASATTAGTATTSAADPNAASDELTLLLFESPKYGDGRGANKPWLQELPDTLTTVMWNGWAEIASRDAERLGIATGDQLELTTGAGSIEAPAVVRPEARPGTIALPLGPGHRDYGRYARGRGRNPLDLIGSDSVEGTTAPALSGARVRARRTGSAKLALYGRGLRQAEQIPTGWAAPPAPTGDGPPMKKDH